MFGVDGRGSVLGRGRGSGPAGLATGACGYLGCWRRRVPAGRLSGTSSLEHRADTFDRQFEQRGKVLRAAPAPAVDVQLDQHCALVGRDGVKLLARVGHHLLPSQIEIGDGIGTFAFDLRDPKLGMRITSERCFLPLALLLLVTVELIALGQHRRDVVSLLA
jgi:hypothetical protein